MTLHTSRITFKILKSDTLRLHISFSASIMQVRLYPRLIPGFVVAAGKFPSAQACHLGMFGCRIDCTIESGSEG